MNTTRYLAGSPSKTTLVKPKAGRVTIYQAMTAHLTQGRSQRSLYRAAYARLKAGL